MVEHWRRVSRSSVYVALAVGFVLLCSPLLAAEPPKSQSSLWFDPTQLPSFTGVVERYLPSPDGRPDRLVFKEGPQIVFPPDVLEAVQHVAPAGRSLVVWGIRARKAPIITMLAFAASEGEATVLDRFYWRAQHGRDKAAKLLLLSGVVKVPYLSPQGEICSAILEDGSVIRVDPAVAALDKERFAEHAKLAVEGPGTETSFGKAIDAERIGETVEKLHPLPKPDSGRPSAQK